MKAKAVLIGEERVRHNRSTRRLVALSGAEQPGLPPAFSVESQAHLPSALDLETSFQCRCSAAKLNPAVVCLTHSLADMLPASYH